MRFLLPLMAVSVIALAGCAPDEKAESTASSPAAHAQHEVVKDGFKAVFHVDAPADPAYTCPMHPEVVSESPGTCPICKMDLAKQTHRIAVEVADEKGQPVKDATVRLTAKDASGLLQGLDLKGASPYQGTFHLAPGAQQITAFVKPAQAAQAVELAMPYEVK